MRSSIAIGAIAFVILIETIHHATAACQTGHKLAGTAAVLRDGVLRTTAWDGNQVSWLETVAVEVVDANFQHLARPRSDLSRRLLGMSEYAGESTRSE